MKKIIAFIGLTILSFVVVGCDSASTNTLTTTQTPISTTSDFTTADQVLTTEENDITTLTEEFTTTEEEITTERPVYTTETTVITTTEIIPTTTVENTNEPTTTEEFDDALVVYATLIDITETSVTVEFIIDDPNDQIIQGSLRLYKGDVFINEYQLIDGYFYEVINGLESNTEYSIFFEAEVYVDTDIIEDFSGGITVSTLEAVSTDPDILNMELKSSPNKIYLDYDAINIDSYGNLLAMIYDDNDEYMIGSMYTGEAIEFLPQMASGLYHLRLEYTPYNMPTQILYEEDFYYVTDLEIVDIYAPQLININEEILFDIILSNDQNLEISSLVLNQETYAEVTMESSRIHLNTGLAITEGDYSVHLELFNILVEGYEYPIYVDYDDVLYVYQDNTSAPVDASIEILDVVTSEQVIDITGETNIVIDIYLQNPYALDLMNIYIELLTYNYLDLYIYSNEHISLKIDIYEGKNDIYITEIDYYLNEELISVQPLYSHSVHVYGYDPLKVIYIDEASDFDLISSSSEDSNVYFLANDIDMTDYYNGQIVLNTLLFGNGYQIYNLNLSRFASSYAPDSYYGFIKLNFGYIFNLDFSNASYTLNNVDYTQPVYLGLIGYNHGVIDNIEMINPMAIEINGFDKAYIGGLTGGNEGVISHVSMQVNINANMNYTTYYQNNSAMGGLVGYLKSGYVNVVNVTGEMTMTVESESVGFYVGGLVGTFIDAYIMNSYVTMEIYSDGSVSGGIVGHSRLYEDTMLVMKQVYATGSMTGHANSTQKSTYMGSFSGDVNALYTIENAFADVDMTFTGTAGNISIGIFWPGNHDAYIDHYVFNQVYYHEDMIISAPQIESLYVFGYSDNQISAISSTLLSSISFYQETLMFSDYIFDFSEINPEQGLYPIHLNEVQ